MKIAICGGTGFLGFNLAVYLKQKGFNIDILSTRANKYQKNQKYNQFNIIEHFDSNEHYDVIINLAGKSIFNLWTAKNKRLFLSSRTHWLNKIQSFNQANNKKIDLIINGSAIGIYANTINKTDEFSEIKEQNFFSQFLCNQIENVANNLQNKNISNQVINVRTGVVFAKNGGFLSRLLPSFKLGLGSAIGTGNQNTSWIDIDDFCKAILFIIQNKTNFSSIDVVNLTSPTPSTNLQISKEIAKVLNRPCIFKIPSFLVKLLFGKMGVELMLSSQKIYPSKLLNNGFQFSYKTSLESISSKVNR